MRRVTATAGMFAATFLSFWNARWSHAHRHAELVEAWAEDHAERAERHVVCGLAAAPEARQNSKPQPHLRLRNWEGAMSQDARAICVHIQVWEPHLENHLAQQLPSTDGERLKSLQVQIPKKVSHLPTPPAPSGLFLLQLLFCVSTACCWEHRLFVFVTDSFHLSILWIHLEMLETEI